MANRNYNLVRGPGYEITNLAGGFFAPGPGAPGPVTNIDGATWFTVTHPGLGLYVLTLSDLFVACYSATFSVSKVSTGSQFTCMIQLPPTVSLNSLVSTTGAIPLRINDIAGAADDPPLDAASVVYFNLVMRNSSVTG